MTSHCTELQSVGTTSSKTLEFTAILGGSRTIATITRETVAIFIRHTA